MHVTGRSGGHEPQESSIYKKKLIIFIDQGHHIAIKQICAVNLFLPFQSFPEPVSMLEI
jgi:hypothetical protein